MKKNNLFFVNKLLLIITALILINPANAQTTFPVNGVADPSQKSYAFINATIVKDANSVLLNATLIIRDRKIISAGNNIAVPKDAVTIDCRGKYIYPSFIDIYSDYGIPVQQRTQTGFNFNAPGQITSATKGAFGWNQAIRPQVNASELFTVDDTKATPFREAGFGTVLSHQKDGIARGTGVLATLANLADNLVVIKDKASANYSFSRGSSTQTYPQSIMGSIALLRQTYLDAEWYKTRPASEGTNLSLQAWNENKNLPQIFEANDKWNDLRADRIGDEFGVQYIIKGGGNEYQRIKEIAGTKASYILSLNYPQAMDVDDPNDARYITLTDMKHWEMAPSNAAYLEKANIPFCFTAAELRDPKMFMANLRKAIDYGLSETKALEALTKTPASLLNVYDKVGSLDAGKLANFLITSGPIFNEKTIIIQNWIQGEKYTVKDDAVNNIAGTYKLDITSAAGKMNYTLDVKSSNDAKIYNNDTLATKFSFDGKLVKINFSPVTPGRRRRASVDSAVRADSGKIKIPVVRDTTRRVSDSSNIADETKPGDDKKPVDETRSRQSGGRPLPQVNIGPSIKLSGINNGTVWQGNGVDTSGNMLWWTATLIKATVAKIDSVKKKEPPKIGKVTYPFNGYGWEELPKQETILIKNATVWTNEKESKLENTDVLVVNGKISQVGKNLSSSNARIIDGTGKHLTPGIIDEHSHIAASSINEGGQSVSSEVRIGDNLNPEDINIYRQLSGGVTTSHILHGSANTIGGQTQLIKLRWGANDEDLKFVGADPFIKFALGENVKRTTSSNNNRFPDTRMGVEEVLVDAFTRAKDYEASKKDASFRRDLELDALVEIMNKKRFITCHSYIQSEITAAMRVAERFGFRFNTFTHILEGYKVADKMKAHGANASTFSDWWNYKQEVVDAIPQNAAIMQRVGLNVAINSDDPEMARRLNQEAAKSIKYAGMNEEDALKMVTLNPAKMLHIDNKTGSIKVGKDADLVLWTDNPLSIYARAQTTIVDGIVEFDRDKDMQLRQKIKDERNRLIQKISGEKRSGTPVIQAVSAAEVLLHCEDEETISGVIENDK
ncbi:MAG: amidohydrolase [Chitinophagaceae bacterium]|nr:amidohydrolase [Chitinophagaceae bacterium]